MKKSHCVDFLLKMSQLKSAFYSFLENHSFSEFTITSNELSIDQSLTSEEVTISIRYETSGIDRKDIKVTIANGMYTSLKQALENAEHVRKFALDLKINGVYNHTNGPVLDFFEILALNFMGYSPKTQDLLIEEWTEFHEMNKDNPYAKCLHYCHSQGALHTKNALMRLPKEIRDRIIVVAIAPATVVPRELCFDSFNYASKRDFVPLGEAMIRHWGATTLEEFERIEILDKIDSDRNQIIWLDPDSNAPLLDHSFKSSTYSDVIEIRIKEYIKCNGQYTYPSGKEK
jgi:hypothetical protein